VRAAAQGPCVARSSKLLLWLDCVVRNGPDKGPSLSVGLCLPFLGVLLQYICWKLLQVRLNLVPCNEIPPLHCFANCRAGASIHPTIFVFALRAACLLFMFMLLIHSVLRYAHLHSIVLIGSVAQWKCCSHLQLAVMISGVSAGVSAGR
jgi:hypothetical protein